MTDGGSQHWKMKLFADRAGVHRNRPAVVALTVGGDKMHFVPADNAGLTALIMNPIQAWFAGVPDSKELPLQETQALPRFVKDLKCSDSIEGGDCGKDEVKYNWDPCDKVPHKAPWHPGW